MKLIVMDFAGPTRWTTVSFATYGEALDYAETNGIMKFHISPLRLS
jgi:hypothetical protein